VAARLVRVYGPAIREGLGLDDAELAGFIRGVMEPMLTRPFGEASLATFLAAMQGQVAKAQGQAIHARSWRARFRRLREQRRLHRDVAGAIGSEFDRGTFLLRSDDAPGIITFGDCCAIRTCGRRPATRDSDRRPAERSLR